MERESFGDIGGEGRARGGKDKPRRTEQEARELLRVVQHDERAMTQ